MKFKLVFLPFLLAGFCFTAVGKHKVFPAFDTARRIIVDTMQHVLLDTLEVSAPAGLPHYQASAPRYWEITHTRIALSFNWNEKTAVAHEWISLHPYFYSTDSLDLDAKSMHIDSVCLVTKTGLTNLDHSYKDNHLKINFGHQLKLSDSIVIYIKYTALPYAGQTGGSAAITDDRGLYFINTDHSVPFKPSEIWTQGETESNSHWMITIDKPNTRFTTQVELLVPDSCTTLSNGALIKQAKGANGMRTDIWKMDLPIQAYAVMFAIGKFSIIKDKWKTKEVNYYVEPEYAQYAGKMFNHTPEMIDFFSTITGVPFPWNKYSQVVVRDYVSGAMENTSASLFGEFMNQDAREIADKNSEDVVSHELFHQWFGDYVTCESWSNITVNESFANYGEQLWRTHKYGKSYADELAWADLQGYCYSAFMKDPQLVRFNYDSREEVFDAISYNKGGAVLHYLNTLIGDPAFYRAMRLYLTKNALHSAEANNWRLAVEEATGLDYNWFFNEFYYHAGHPVIKVNYHYDDTLGKLTVGVTQTQDDSTFSYDLPLKTAIIYGNDKTIVDWDINKRKQTFTYDYRNGVKPVLVPDYDHVLPGELKDNKKAAQWLTEFKNCDDYVSKRLALVYAGKQVSDSISREILDLGLNNEKSIRFFSLSILENVISDKYRKKWAGKVMEMAAHDSASTVRASALKVLGEWKIEEAKPLFLSALPDSSYLVAGNALEALARIDKDTAYILAKKIFTTHSRSYLRYAIWTIIANKGADEDIALLEHDAPYVQGAKIFGLAGCLSKYMKQVKSDASFSRGVAIYVSKIETEGIKNYKSALNGMLIQLLTDEKGDIKSDNADESAIAQKRFDIVKAALQKVIDADADETEKEHFQKLLKENTES